MLSGSANAGNGQSGIYSRSYAAVEKLAFKVYLTVSYRNNIGRYICGYISAHRFDNRQCSYASAAVLLIHTGTSFKQAAMEIKHVSGESLSAGRSVKQKRHSSVSYGVL